MSSVIFRDTTYSNVLAGNKVRYIPSCLLLHMILKASSQLSVMNVAGNLDTLVPDLTSLMEQLTRTILQTANAYKNAGSMFFPGDWKKERTHARKVLHEILSRIGYVAEILGENDKNKFLENVKRTASAWIILDGIMDEKMRQDAQAAPEARVTPFFRNENRTTWKQTMARTIIELAEETKLDDPSEYLLLFCHRRVRNSIASEIESLERNKLAENRFDTSRLLCIYQDDLPISCCNCTHMTGGGENSTRAAVRSCYLRRHRETMVDSKKTTRIGSR